MKALGFVFRNLRPGFRSWLPDMDLNHDKQIQSLLCYRYTIGQTGGAKVGGLQQESSQGSFWKAILAAFIVSAVASNAVADEKSKAGTLLVYILSVESSHAKDFERPAGERFDTVQWWVGEGGNWRIKTYAIEADIHPYKLETKMPTAEVLQLAKRNTKKAYGDVIRRLVEVAVPAGLTNDELGKLLKKQGLSASFEWVEAGCLLWKPDEPDYRSQTKPK